MREVGESPPDESDRPIDLWSIVLGDGSEYGMLGLECGHEFCDMCAMGEGGSGIRPVQSPPRGVSGDGRGYVELLLDVGDGL